MHLAVRLGALALLVGALASCQQAPSSVIGPSSMGGLVGAARSENQLPSAALQVLGETVSGSQGVQKGVICRLDGFGDPVETQDSRLVISGNGINKTLVCFGPAHSVAVPGVEDFMSTNFLCFLGPTRRGVFLEQPGQGEETTENWHAVITPSRKVTLTCEFR